MFWNLELKWYLLLGNREIENSWKLLPYIPVPVRTAERVVTIVQEQFLVPGKEKKWAQKLLGRASVVYPDPEPDRVRMILPDPKRDRHPRHALTEPAGPNLSNILKNHDTCDFDG